MAAVVIILSHAYSLPANEDKKVTTEQTDDTSKSVISTPSDAVTQASLVRVDEQVPESVIEVLGEPKNQKSLYPHPKVILTSLFQTFFRFVIAPNAP